MEGASEPLTDRLAPLLGVAREAITARLEQREPRFETGGPAFARRAPIFCTVRIDGALRGCIGSLVPKSDDLTTETASRAVSAAFGDSRFPPHTIEELPRMTVEISVLADPEPVDDPGELDPIRFGVIVVAGDGRRGVLLPSVEGVDTVEEQLSIARRKAGIGPREPVRIQRFETLKLRE